MAIDNIARGLALQARTHPGFISGNWYQPILGADVGGGAAAGTGTIRLLPIWLPKPITISQLGTRITTAAAGGNCQLALYANNAATGRPTGNALCSTGSMSTASAANVSAAVGAPTPLNPDLYWMALNQDNATVAYQTLNNTKVLAAFLIGSATLANISGGAAAGAFGLSVTQTFGTWPDLTSASFTEVSGVSQNGLVYLKAA